MLVFTYPRYSYDYELKELLCYTLNEIILDLGVHESLPCYLAFPGGTRLNVPSSFSSELNDVMASLMSHEAFYCSKARYSNRVNSPIAQIPLESVSGTTLLLDRDTGQWSVPRATIALLFSHGTDLNQVQYDWHCNHVCCYD